MLDSPLWNMAVVIVGETVPCGSSASWRKEAKAVLGKLTHLNRSQTYAIATALTKTISLWQVTFLHVPVVPPMIIRFPA